MSLSDINIREKEFHNKLQSNKKGRFENIFYRALYKMFEDFNDYISNKAKNNIVLDYGCGIGSITEKIAKSQPQKIFGIDISDVSINKAKNNSKGLNLNINYSVDNCESTKFNNETFDLVYGSGILHHLELKVATKEINRILKKNGEMVFLEPLGTNLFINLYRKITPNSRSVDEHPLIDEDFKYLNSLFNSVRINYYGFFTLLFFLFYRDPKNSWIYKISNKLDNFIFKFNFFKKLAWSVMIIAKKA